MLASIYSSCRRPYIVRMTRKQTGVLALFAGSHARQLDLGAGVDARGGLAGEGHRALVNGHCSFLGLGSCSISCNRDAYRCGVRDIAERWGIGQATVIANHNLLGRRLARSIDVAVSNRIARLNPANTYALATTVVNPFLSFDAEVCEIRFPNCIKNVLTISETIIAVWLIINAPIWSRGPSDEAVARPSKLIVLHRNRLLCLTHRGLHLPSAAVRVICKPVTILGVIDIDYIGPVFRDLERCLRVNPIKRVILNGLVDVVLRVHHSAGAKGEMLGISNRFIGLAVEVINRQRGKIRGVNFPVQMPCNPFPNIIICSSLNMKLSPLRIVNYQRLVRQIAHDSA